MQASFGTRVSKWHSLSSKALVIRDGRIGSNRKQPSYHARGVLRRPITNSTGNDGSSGGSSKGTAIGILIAIAVLTVGAAYVANTPGGFKLPNFNLPFPLGA